MGGALKDLKRITIDFETRSMSDLRKEGAYKYSLHSTTQPTCLAFKIRSYPEVSFFRFEQINKFWGDQSIDFQRMWKSFIHDGFLFVAHNAFFERCIYTNVLVKRYDWPEIPVKLWRCTAAKVAACALPRNLEGAGESLSLSVQKDKMGYVAMMATCKPTKRWNAWNKAALEKKAGVKIGARKQAVLARGAPKVFLEYKDDPRMWEVLYRYCKIDVIAEELLDETLPDLIPSEQEIWHLNQKLNWRGLRVDVPTVTKIVDIMATESKKKLKELDSLTLGLVTKAGARKSILEFLALDDIILKDIRAKTVEDVLKGGQLSDDMRRLLEIRQALSKTSTKKYQCFLDRAGQDERIRDILLYHGASTGRDAGTGVQPHNFPRGALEVDEQRPYATVENVHSCSPEMLNLLYGDSLTLVFSAILRNMLIPSEGCEMFVADFAKIEVAVLWWLSENKAGLRILNSGKDPYIYMASANTGKSYKEVEAAIKTGEKWAIDARQLGKAQVLGCGFGMGWEKFKATAWDQYRLKLDDVQSKKAVSSYREANRAVSQMWKNVERAAIMAVEDGVRTKAAKCKFFTKDRFLWVELPSGRRLAYLDPKITWREADWGPQKTLEFSGVDKSKKKIQRERTWGGTFTENIVQAVARDLMMPGMLRLENAKYRALLMVHDEGICERQKGEGSLKEFLKILLERPSWADKSLPLDAKGWIGPRYRK